MKTTHLEIAIGNALYSLGTFKNVFRAMRYIHRTKGPKWAWYRVTAQDGEIFEYCPGATNNDLNSFLSNTHSFGK